MPVPAAAVDGRTTRHTGYALSQRKRKRIEECFGWLKTIALMRKVRHRGVCKVHWIFTLACAAYNLVRMRNLSVPEATPEAVRHEKPKEERASDQFFSSLLYGTTTGGGARGAGVVFTLTSKGKETVLYNFCAQTNCADGANPYAGLVLDQKGNLYGTTNFGGAYESGTAFKLTP